MWHMRMDTHQCSVNSSLFTNNSQIVSEQKLRYKSRKRNNKREREQIYFRYLWIICKYFASGKYYSYFQVLKFTNYSREQLLFDEHWYTFSKNYMSLALMVMEAMCIGDLEGKYELFRNWIIFEAVLRTALSSEWSVNKLELQNTYKIGLKQCGRTQVQPSPSSETLTFCKN